MHVAAFIGELQHYKNFKPSYLSTGKWAISPFLSDKVLHMVIFQEKQTDKYEEKLVILQLIGIIVIKNNKGDHLELQIF